MKWMFDQNPQISFSGITDKKKSKRTVIKAFWSQFPKSTFGNIILYSVHARKVNSMFCLDS